MADAKTEKRAQHIRCRTVRLVTYSGKSKKPASVGTGVVLEYGSRWFVITNTHVLERFYELRKNGDGPSIQVASGSGTAGYEHHAGYFLMPDNESSTALGVTSKYDHLDVGIIELEPGARAELACINEAELRRVIPLSGETVLTLGFPYKPGEFDGNRKAGFPDSLAQESTLRECCDRLLIMNRPTGGGGKVEGQLASTMPLKGISGCGAFDEESKLVGIVWGGCEARNEIYICPTERVLSCLDEYISRQNR